MSVPGQRENTLVRFREFKELSQRRSSCPLWLQHTHTRTYTLKAILLHLVTFIPFSPLHPTPAFEHTHQKHIHNIHSPNSHHHQGTHSSTLCLTQLRWLSPSADKTNYSKSTLSGCLILWGLSLILSLPLSVSLPVCHWFALSHKPQKDQESAPDDLPSKNINRATTHKNTYSITTAEVHDFLCETRLFNITAKI